MKAKKRLTYLKSQKETNIEWILNLLDQIPKYQLQQSNMRPAKSVQGLQECDSILRQQLYTYVPRLEKFVLMEFTLFPNMLTQSDVDGSRFLVLSSCSFTKKVIQYKESIAQGVVLSNSQGFTFMFYESYVQQINWEKQLKKFCKLQNFQQKYSIKEKLSLSNHFACVKNKNNRFYTVQLIKHPLLNDQLYDAIMNEINILMCFKQAGLPQFHSLYEDSEMMYILYEYFIGDSLYKLIQQGFKLSMVQISEIIFQVMKVTRFLHQNALYHGSILPTTVILLRPSNTMPTQQIKVILCNFSYREANHNNWQWFTKRIPKVWAPPELLTKQPTVKIEPPLMDIYMIGSLLYYLTLFNPTQNIRQVPFCKSLDLFNINFNKLQQLLQQSEVINGPIIISHSLIELLVGLLDPEPSNRTNLTATLAHQWFVGQRLKAHQDKPKVLASLRTILELREQSSCDYLSSRLAKEDQVFFTSSDEDDGDVAGDENDNIHKISKENNSIPHYLNYLNRQPIKHPSRKSIIIQTDQVQFSQI